MKKIKFIILLVLVAFAFKGYSAYIYMRSNTSQPWGVNNNENAMTGALGAWTQAFYETANPVTLLVPTNCFIFMEGGDGNATAFNTFITTNMVAIQNWVNAGGRLIFNAAPNVGANITYGFGGVILNYNGGASLASNGNAAAGQAGHPIFNGPFLPCGIAFTGNYFAHAYVTGGAVTNLINDAPGNSLTFKAYGAGRVMFGGMTTDNWQSPSPNSQNLRKNIITWMACAVLPIELASFTGKQIGVKNELEWSTQAELDNNYFTIEKSVDAENFNELERISGAGDSHKLLNYSYTDAIPGSGGNYYRLKQTDNSGKSTYSGIIYINRSATLKAIEFADIRPNPTSTNLYIDLTSTENIPVTTEIKDIYGKVILQNTSEAVLGTNCFDLKLESVSKGFYFVSITSGNSAILNTKFIKN